MIKKICLLKNERKVYLLAISFVISLNGYAQLKAEQKIKTINTALEIIETRYVLRDILPVLNQKIIQYYTDGRYDTIRTGSDFAFRLTQDLQEISNDPHLKVLYKDNMTSTGSKANEKGATKDQWLKDLMIENDYGIKQKSILKGNIGYINIPLFGPLRDCSDTLIAAMNYIANTSALIIDLRECRGSLDENTIPFIFSYFFKEPTHIDDFYIRETNTTRQFWTYGYVPGSLYLDKPIYLLTSGKTFSGGEAFAYHLQQLKRATVIGEVTRGGANPSELQQIDSSFSITVPYASSINAISHTNWGNVGVVPDVKTKSILAKYEATSLALKELISVSKDVSVKADLENALQSLKRPVLIKVTFSLKGFTDAKEVAVAGTFNAFSRKSLLLQKVGDRWVGEADVENSYIYVK